MPRLAFVTADFRATSEIVCSRREAARQIIARLGCGRWTVTPSHHAPAGVEAAIVYLCHADGAVIRPIAHLTGVTAAEMRDQLETLDVALAPAAAANEPRPQTERSL